MSDAVVETPVTVSPGSVEVEDRTSRSSMSGPSVVKVEQTGDDTSVAPKEEKKEAAPAKKERVAPKLASIRAREAEAEKKAAEADARLKEAEEKASKLELLKKSPSKVLSELGLSFNDLAAAILAEGEDEGQTPDELETLKSEFNSFKQSLEEKEQKTKEEIEAAQRAELDQAIANLKTVINRHIDENPDQFEMIRLTGQQDTVFEIIEESWNQRGETIPYEEACKLLENVLFDKVKTLSGSKKLQELMAPTPVKKPQTKTSFGKTISGQLGQLTTTDGKPDLSKMSHDERIRYLTKNVLRFN